MSGCASSWFLVWVSVLAAAASSHQEPGRHRLLLQHVALAVEPPTPPDVSVPGAGQLSTYSCDPGSYYSGSWHQPYDRSTCSQCKQGHFSNEATGARRCWKCEHGFTTIGEGSTTCPVCAAGHGGATCNTCAPGTWSAGLTEGREACKPCLPASVDPASSGCQQVQSVQCDPKTGKSFHSGYKPNGLSCRAGKGSCWRGKCACHAGFGGADCSDPCPPNTYSNGRMSACAECKAVKPGPCVERVTCDPKRGNLFFYRQAGTPCGAGSVGRCTKNGLCACAPGTGGPDCSACEPFTFSPGLAVGQPCRPCLNIPICRCLPGPCERLPPCDVATGQPLPNAPCFVPKPDGTICEPRPASGSSSGADGGSDAVAVAAVWPSCSHGSTADDVKDDVTYTCHAGSCEAGINVDACVGFPCTDGTQGGIATCNDLPPPALNDTAGRSCSCNAGFEYAGDSVGCIV